MRRGRSISVLLVVLLISGCSTTMTNAVGETRTCSTVGAGLFAGGAWCQGKEACIILGSVIGAVTIATAGYYQWCVYRAHQDGYA
jgi:hypothetical protein